MARIIRYIIYWCSYKQINKRNKKKKKNNAKKQKITQIGKRQMCLLLQINSAPSKVFQPDTSAFIYNPISLRCNAFVTGSLAERERERAQRIHNLWPHKNHKAAQAETLLREDALLKIETGHGTAALLPLLPSGWTLRSSSTTFDLHVQLSADISRLFGYG